MEYHLCEYARQNAGFGYQSFSLGGKAMEVCAQNTSMASCQKVEVHYDFMECLKHLVFLYFILWTGFKCFSQCYWQQIKPPIFGDRVLMAFLSEDFDEMHRIFIIHSSFGALCSVIYIERICIIECDVCTGKNSIYKYRDNHV